MMMRGCIVIATRMVVIISVVVFIIIVIIRNIIGNMVSSILPIWDQGRDFHIDHLSYMRRIMINYIQLFHHFISNINGSISNDVEREVYIPSVSCQNSKQSEHKNGVDIRK